MTLGIFTTKGINKIIIINSVAYLVQFLLLQLYITCSGLDFIFLMYIYLFLHIFY